MASPGPNRRRFVRVRVALRVEFSWEGGSQPYASWDVSAGGLLCRKLVPSDAVPPARASGVARFAFEGTTVTVEAQVVRLTPDGFALRFVGLPEGTQDRLAAWVFRQEAQRRASWG